MYEADCHKKKAELLCEILGSVITTCAESQQFKPKKKKKTWGQLKYSPSSLFSLALIVSMCVWHGYSQV